MHYPIAIEHGDETHAFGVVVPDLPGCFSAGDTLEEAIVNATEAISLWLEDALDLTQAIPAPSPVDRWANDPEYQGWTFALVKVDPAALDDTIERVNITLPRRVLHRLDQRARAAGETRSGFIARLALNDAA
ncbi:type II toxin-antitoxin system HicB family antitoxin [Lysobacter soli]|uniref:type II toxin-antitoxin system HicB family antitoxin n=1 Tax=Lysobacter soli TaxID=453783 RepID=UPI00209E5855|nr:type II toxin-antitoxin system HicB family antitoxin [Lysobacter soli]UTA52956.1 type II toxin-antitoxin system HicB family antitoxin [Lysobacter soli]